MIAALLPLSFKFLLVLQVSVGISPARVLTALQALTDGFWLTHGQQQWHGETIPWSNTGLAVPGYPKNQRRIQVMAWSSFLTGNCSLFTQDKKETFQNSVDFSDEITTTTTKKATQ